MNSFITNVECSSYPVEVVPMLLKYTSLKFHETHSSSYLQVTDVYLAGSL